MMPQNAALKQTTALTTQSVPKVSMNLQIDKVQDLKS
jgi:hypothetical protein